MWQETLTTIRQLAHKSPPNFFILGNTTSEQRNQALQELRSSRGRDAYRPQEAARFELPCAPTGLLVIDDVAALSADDQRALMQWLGGHGDATVLSFAKTPVFPLVANGTFLEGLFYRLNVITLTVDDEAAAQAL